MQSHSDKFSRWEIHNIMKTSDIEQIDHDEKNSLSRSSNQDGNDGMFFYILTKPKI